MRYFSITVFAPEGRQRVYWTTLKKIKKIFKSIFCLFLSVFVFSGEATGAVIINSSLAVSQNYDDNLFFEATDKKSDYATIVSPALNIRYTSKNIILTVGYSGSAQFHSQHPETDGYFQSLSIDLDLPILNRQIKGVRVSVIEDMSFSPELPGFSFGGGEDEESSERAARRPQNSGQGVDLGRTDTFQNQAGLSLSYDWTERFNTTASYTNVITRVSGNAVEDREAHQTTFDGNYHRQMTSRAAWTAVYGAALTTGDGKDQLIHSVNLGIDYQITKLITVDGSAGASFLRDESAQHTLSAGVSKRFQAGSIDISYSNGISTGLGVIRSVTRNESVTGSVNRVLSEKASLYLRLGYSRNESLSGDEVDASTSTASTGISVQLLEWLSGGLDYSYLKQNSSGMTGAGGESERNLVTLSLTASGPSWRIIK